MRTRMRRISCLPSPPSLPLRLLELGVLLDEVVELRLDAASDRRLAGRAAEGPERHLHPAAEIELVAMAYDLAVLELERRIDRIVDLVVEREERERVVRVPVRARRAAFR